MPRTVARLALAVLVLCAAPNVRATPPLSPEAYDRYQRTMGLASGLSIGVLAGGGLVTMIGGSVAMKQPEAQRQRRWAIMNLVMGSLNLGAGFCWSIGTGVAFNFGDPWAIGAVVAHAGVGITDLILGAGGYHRWKEAHRPSIAPVVIRDLRLGDYAGAAFQISF